MERKNLHKTILALIVVITPMFFLMFTDDGKRLTDNTILWVLGDEPVSLNIKALDSGYSRDDLFKVFPELQWQCRDETSSFGNQVCAAPIGSFNDYPAHRLIAYFADDRTNALKVDYREAYHEQLLGYLIMQLGQPRNAAAAADAEDSTVLEWETDTGLLLLKQELGDKDEPALLWLAKGRS